MTTSLLGTPILGQSVNVAQSYAIKNALTAQRLNERLTNLTFWGKISVSGSKDYYIARATETNTNIAKKFYYSNNEGVTFSILPEVDSFVNDMAPRIRGMFTGDTAYKYRDPNKKKKINEDGEEEEWDDEDEEEEEQEQEDEFDEDGNKIEKKPDPSLRKLTELERLSWTVRAIDHDTCVVPRGSHYMTATGNIQRNAEFDGLTVAEAQSIDSYQLYRTPTDAKTLARNRRQGVANNVDFLDTIVPQGTKTKDTWCLHVDESGLNVSLRSLVWLGYEYKLEAGTTNYVGGYFGDGQKNVDILFML